jgi:hypothetical protein
MTPAPGECGTPKVKVARYPVALPRRAWRSAACAQAECLRYLAVELRWDLGIQQGTPKTRLSRSFAITHGPEHYVDLLGRLL